MLQVPKCEISGGGLKTALAGQAATVQIVCKDRFGNPLNGERERLLPPHTRRPALVVEPLH